jgi:hypothetical protein
MNANSSDDYNIALHEGAHAVVATTFKIPAMPELTPNGFSVLAQTTEPGTAGLCHFDNGKITPWQSAVISWAGVMTEALFGHRQFWMPPFKPSHLMLRDWHWALLQQIGRLSATDRAGILEYKNTMRSCESAYRLVTKHKTRIVRLAKAMTAGRKVTPSLPLPEQFPATHADFVRLICASDEANFEQFIAGRTALHLTNGRTSNLEDAKLSLGTSFADAYAMSLNLQRSIYAGDFKTETDWFAAARPFLEWAKAEAVKKSTNQTL